MRYYELETLVLLLVHLCSGLTQDLLVSVGPKIQIYSTNGTAGNKPYASFEPDPKGTIKGVSVNNTGLFYSHSIVGNSSIHFVPFDALPKSSASQLLLSPKDYSVESICYVQSISTFFWTESRTKVIHSASISGGSLVFNESTPFLKLGEEDLPKSLVYDECSSRLFWTNWNYKNPSIESVFINGTGRRDVVRNALYQPLGLAIFGNRLFFTNSKPEDYYDIESVSVDGTNRQVHVKGYDQHPISIAVTRASIFWADSRTRSVWYLPDRDAQTAQPKLFFYGGSETPTSVAVMKPEQNVCSALPSKEPEEAFTLAENLVVAHRDNEYDACSNYCLHGVCKEFPRGRQCTCDTGYTGLRCEIEICPTEYCGHNGDCRPQDGHPKCVCHPGFEGHNCEIDICHQFCLNGLCAVQQNKPTCMCSLGFTGDRCEREVCADHCFNGGECVLAGSRPSCVCPDSYHGDRCQDSLCDNYCLNEGSCSFDNRTAVCQCSDGFYGSRCENLLLLPEVICRNYCFNGGTCSSMSDGSVICSCASDFDGTRCEIDLSLLRDETLLIPLIACSTLSFVLLVLGIGMACKIFQLLKRPRLRKHFVVNKPKALSQKREGSDGIQLELENCCNMNVCETPCFEPKTRPGSSRSNKKEEKYNLLKNTNDLF